MESRLIVRIAEDGRITFKGDYQDAVERLCQLEDWYKPGERYTVRREDGTAFPRRGIELVMGRLEHYERREREL